MAGVCLLYVTACYGCVSVRKCIGWFPKQSFWLFQEQGFRFPFFLLSVEKGKKNTVILGYEGQYAVTLNFPAWLSLNWPFYECVAL